MLQPLMQKKLKLNGSMMTSRNTTKKDVLFIIGDWNAKVKKLKLNGSMMTSRNNTKKDVLFIIGDWNAKVGSQEIPGVTGKFCFWVQNEAGQRIEFYQENALVIAKTLFQQHKRRLYTWTPPDGQR